MRGGEISLAQKVTAFFYLVNSQLRRKMGKLFNQRSLRFLKGMTPEGMTPEGKVTSTRSTGNIGPGRTPGTDERTQDAKEN